jgi:hypothetical protein
LRTQQCVELIVYDAIVLSLWLIVPVLVAPVTGPGECDWPGFKVLFGEFDPGSGRTLAACLTHASRTDHCFRVVVSGERVSNTWVTCPSLWDNSGKPGLILDMTSCCMVWGGKFFGEGWARGLSACWWGDGLPRRRRVAGLRGRPATLGLRHGPDSCGRQQWGILRNGRKPDAATPREG